MRTHTKIGIGIIILAVLIALYYGISPLFNVKEVHDEMPEAMLEHMDDMPDAFPIMDTTAHPASGSVRILETKEGRVLRFEDFETINGPQLHLYLSKDLEAKEYIDLGPIRGTKGDINYVIPEGVDLSEYRYVMHWCVPFSVLFNYADLGA